MDKLIFVYNADSSFLAVANDFVRKLVAPNSQECNLCKITYGVTGKKEAWGDYLATLPMEKVFLHKNEFRGAYPNEARTELPAIFVENEDHLSLFMSAEEINKTRDISELINAINQKIPQLSGWGRS